MDTPPGVSAERCKSGHRRSGVPTGDIFACWQIRYNSALQNFDMLPDGNEIPQRPQGISCAKHISSRKAAYRKSHKGFISLLTIKLPSEEGSFIVSN